MSFLFGGRREVRVEMIDGPYGGLIQKRATTVTRIGQVVVENDRCTLRGIETVGLDLELTKSS